MRKTRKRYTREFKVGAVRLVLESGEPVSKIAKEIGVHPNTLKVWMVSVFII